MDLDTSRTPVGIDLAKDSFVAAISDGTNEVVRAFPLPFACLMRRRIFQDPDHLQIMRAHHSLSSGYVHSHPLFSHKAVGEEAQM